MKVASPSRLSSVRELVTHRARHNRYEAHQMHSLLSSLFDQLSHLRLKVVTLKEATLKEVTTKG
jgi:hypothetical protein